VARPAFGDDEKAACAVAGTGFIDTIGTLFAGCHEPVVDIVLDHARSNAALSEAPVPFADVMLSAAQAANVNAVAAHALDYDDVALAGHPSTVLVPAILAEGHHLDLAGAAALRAYVVGYEVWAELVGRETDQYHLKGWHPTGVLGTVAAAAAVATLHGLDAQHCSHALAIAASMASGLVANFGTMSKPLHAGRAAANAIEAVHLAMRGLTAAPDVFEHRAGYLNALSPAGRVDTQRPAGALGRRPRILDTGLSIKRYPVCYSAHRIIDGVLAIAERENLQAAQVTRVTLSIGAAQASMLRNRMPVTSLEAKFSAEFAVAAALVARQVGLAELTDGFVTRDDVRNVFGKVEVKVTERSCPIDPTFAYADRVVIDLADGRSFNSGEIRFALGNAMNPIDAAGLRCKFMDCLAAGAAAGAHKGGIVVPNGSKLYERLAGLADLTRLRRLFV